MRSFYRLSLRSHQIVGRCQSSAMTNHCILRQRSVIGIRIRREWRAEDEDGKKEDEAQKRGIDIIQYNMLERLELLMQPGLYFSTPNTIPSVSPCMPANNHSQILRNQLGTMIAEVPSHQYQYSPSY